MTTSVLDGIPGLGPVRQKRLRKELGGVAGVRKATLEELQALPWLPEAVAEAVYRKIHTPAVPRRSLQPIPFTAPRPAPTRLRPRTVGGVGRLVAGGFTDGADAEYDEQILPLAAPTWPGAASVLDVGTGEGQIARLASAGGATRVAGSTPR